MNPIVYALFAYGLTAVISYAVIAIVVAINAIISKKESAETREGRP